MKFNLPKIKIPWNRKFIIAFSLMTFLCIQAHEFGHQLIATILCETPGYMTFAYANIGGECSPIDEVLELAAGPLVTYSLTWFGVFLLLKHRKYALLGCSLIFANTVLDRIIFGTLIGDERNIGEFIGHPFVVLFVVILLVLPPLLIAYKSIKNKRKLLVFLSFLIIPILATGFIIIMPDTFFLFNPLMENESTFPIPLVFGIPIIVIIVDVIVLALFFGKYVQFLLPNKKDVKE
ncbi:hypothetical protein CVT91_13655 [Candidatus Atribacteria bacterium HGW-Atribacteria-1]|nr:MAG: hypothetical protein CVT91_13655 [Candidatus Atribacteria bacterium HGW-Atribacteria-1]